MERLTKYITPVGKCMTTLNSMKHYMPCVPCRHKAEIKTDSKGNMYTEKFSFCDTCEVKMLFNKLKEYEDAEEQGLLLRLPCRLGDIIDRIISHNETVTLMFETEVSSFRGLQHFWHGAAWNIPKEYLELPFVKIHGVVPDKITEADTIWIEVRKEAEQALAKMKEV